VAFIREPALAIWQATKCLAEIHARTEAPSVATIIAEAEMILLGLMLALIHRSDDGEIGFGSTGRKERLAWTHSIIRGDAS
jgi:hypothetical protein